MKPVIASATMITISMPPVMISSFLEIAMPAYVAHATGASPTIVTIHHGTVMPYSDLSAGSSTVLEKNENVSTPTGGA